jgi:hypothetical protein
VRWDAPGNTCTHKLALFWLLYNRRMLQVVKDDWYRVEDTPPCAVAALAGLGEVSTQCNASRTKKGPGRGEAHGYLNRKNTQGLVVEWEALDGAPAPFANLRSQVQALAKKLGYPVPVLEGAATQ